MKISTNKSLDFRIADIMTDDYQAVINQYLTDYDTKQFSFVSCFSITMWIHMNHNDDGLLSFITKSCNNCSHTIIIEPQPWKCYRNAIQRCRRQIIPELPFYQSLIIRDVESYLRDVLPTVGFPGCHTLGAKEWGRVLLVFHRRSSDGIEALFQATA